MARPNAERLILVLFALTVLVLAATAVTAFRQDPVELSAEVVVARPPDQLWRYVLEPDQRTRWQYGIVAILPLTGDYTDVGSRQLLDRRRGRDRWDEEEETTAIAPSRRWQATRVSDRARVAVAVELTAQTGGTRVRYSMRTAYLGWWDRLIAPIKRLGERDRMPLYCSISLLTVTSCSANPLQPVQTNATDCEQ